MTNKKIYRHTNVELLDLIKNGVDKTIIKKAKSEFNSRKLTLKQKEKIELDYLKYKDYQNNRKEEPLTKEEWLTFFFLPFFTPRPKDGNDHFSESEFERYSKYGFEKKAKQAATVKKLGIIFWFAVFIIVFAIYNYTKKL